LISRARSSSEECLRCRQKPGLFIKVEFLPGV
jgi:hypothetical protein